MIEAVVRHLRSESVLISTLLNGLQIILLDVQAKSIMIPIAMPSFPFPRKRRSKWARVENDKLECFHDSCDYSFSVFIHDAELIWLN